MSPARQPKPASIEQPIPYWPTSAGWTSAGHWPMSHARARHRAQFLGRGGEPLAGTFSATQDGHKNEKTPLLV